MNYRILLDNKVVGQKNGICYINEEGARIIWEAYKKMNPYGTTQSMERREQRGGVCWLSEISLFKEKGLLPKTFDLTNYIQNDVSNKSFSFNEAVV